MISGVVISVVFNVMKGVIVVMVLFSMFDMVSVESRVVIIIDFIFMGFMLYRCVCLNLMCVGFRCSGLLMIRLVIMVLI